MRKEKLITIITAGILVVLLNGCSDEEDTVASTAATTSTSSSSTNTGDLGDSTPTGKVTANGFFLLYAPAIAPFFTSALAYTQTDVAITVNAEDVNDLVALNGQTVNFKAEWGAWLDEKDSCELVNGQCTVNWRSGNPFSAPGSCRVAITAWTEGEEAFFDANDNGVFDASDATFTDLEEPFLDIDGSGTYTAAISTADLRGEFIDIIDFTGATPGTRDGVHNAGNALYDGSLCAAGNALCNTSRTSMIIHARSTLLIQTPFTETADENGNGTSLEKDIVFCGSNLY